MNPEAPFLFDHQTQRLYTYGHLATYAQHLQSYFHERGVRQLGLIARNDAQFTLATAACWILEVPIFPISPKTQKADLEKIMELLPKLSWVHWGTMNNPFFDDIDTIQLPELPNQTASADNFEISETPEHIFAWLMTSGTTANPKIVPLKRRQMISAARASASHCKPGEGDYWMQVLPMHHIGGLSIVYRSLLYGSALYLMPKFDAGEIAQLLDGAKKSIKIASLVPTMLHRMLQSSLEHLPGQFHHFLLGGGPVPAALAKEIQQGKWPVRASYGMTETSAQIASIDLNSFLEDPRVDTAIPSGRLFPPNEIEIRNKRGEPLPAMTSGTIWLKGPQVFDGYLNRSSDYQPFDDRGFFNTGDFGYLDAEDRLFVETRREDLILTGGENVVPETVEKALFQLEEIKDAAVLGLPDEEWGEVVTAALVLQKDQKPSLATIRSRLAGQLAPHQLPRKVVLVSEIPKTGSGKVRRNQLKKWLQNRNRI